MTPAATPSRTPRAAVAQDLLFPTPIYHADVTGAAAINAHLKPLIYAWREQDPDGDVRTNEPELGGWHSHTDMHMREEFAVLREEIYAFMEGVFSSLGYDPAYGPACGSMWANVNPRLAANRHHTHPDALWSGVYYVQAPPDCGHLYFSDPRVQAAVLPPHYAGGDRPAGTWSEVHCEPVEGRVLAFPAWLAHAVLPNRTAVTGAAGDRISVSFNYHQRLRNAPQPAV